MIKVYNLIQDVPQNGNKVYANLLKAQFKFWKNPHITEEEFLKKADTGDILLFRSVSNRLFGQWVIRGVSGSDFDHVGMIMRFGDSLSDMFVFEAVG